MKQLLMALYLSVLLILPVQAREPQSLQQYFIDMLIQSTIIAFENPDTRNELSRLSEIIKDEQSYQYILQRIDQFIIANELHEYKQQAEELKAFITQSRELYLQSEKEAIEQYRRLQEQQQQREKERQLKAAGIIEV